jgi:Family of unknown function (DUF5677)
MTPKSKIRKKGKTKKIISDWENFWEDHSEWLLPPTSWNDSRIEVLHIAIALQDFELDAIIRDLKKLKQKLSELEIQYFGNLSVLFQAIKLHPDFLTEIRKTVFDKSFKALIATYSSLFEIQVPEGNLLAHKFIYKAYHESQGRHNDISILCKFIILKFSIGEKSDPFGILNSNDRQKILSEPIVSQITAMWLAVVDFPVFVNSNFSAFIWNYNYHNLPFLARPSDIKKETMSFKKNKINALKGKLTGYFEEFKKIDLLNYLTLGVAEICMGFIARQQYLFEKVIEQEERHEGEIAESTLRLLYENRLKCIWLITKKEVGALKQFREYKVGREALFFEHFKAQTEGKEEFDSLYQKLNEQLSAVMKEEGIEENQLAIEKGDTFEKNIKEMADDIGGHEPLLYFTVYKRSSDIIHGNWRILERYHLEKSINPAHNGLLRYSTTPEKFAGLLPSFLALIFSTGLLIRFLELHEDILKENTKLYNALSKLDVDLNKRYLKEFFQKN